ncbi:MAG: hypothetical protein KAX57_13780 [Rhodoferax sp.]|jgi:hypothetical protein|uniref:hypothetical protein n=1 Tax=Rhodoferax sp. TaxID=50421 RepID=UPI001B5B90F2|nr:hypothetical protein [Rhodoferax sp.]MBP8287892.1 hypothetical protein [Rhodoferax sp.]MBP9737154.1 hypothetical protein [Rhodoferax sp.]
MATTSTPDPQRLQQTIERLEARFTALERCVHVSGNSVRLHAGSSTLNISSNGVAIQAGEIALASTGKIIIKSGSDLVLRGRKITEN